MIRKEHDEVYTRWGNTDAYKEHTNKTKDYTKEKWDEINNGLMAIFEEFAKFMKRSESLKNSQILVVKLKNYITGNYYTCTNEILAGLGHMYFFDERFKENIDKYGEGTAKFINKSIELYVKEKIRSLTKFNVNNCNKIPSNCKNEFDFISRRYQNNTYV